jgi:hypothetical protein
MKKCKKCLFAIGLLALLSKLASAQQYSVDWYKVAGGGGTSTGGVYAVSGTIGQHDAAQLMSGGNYSLNGGFWALYTLQAPGAPLLTISLTATNTAIVFWPSPSTGFVLQQNPDANSTNWSDFSGRINDNGLIRSVTIPSNSGRLFFRLRK